MRSRRNTIVSVKQNKTENMQNTLDQLLPKAKPEVIAAFVSEQVNNSEIPTVVLPAGVSMEDYIANHMDPLWWIAIQN